MDMTKKLATGYVGQYDQFEPQDIAAREAFHSELIRFAIKGCDASRIAAQIISTRIAAKGVK